MLEVPLISVVNQELNIILGDQNCTIAIYQKEKNTYLDLFVGDSAIRVGALCVPKAPIILKPCNFVGQLYIVDIDSPPNAQTLPNYKELGKRYKLFYLDKQEEESAENGRYNRL